MQTGEELAPSMEFYVNLVAKLDLTEQQARQKGGAGEVEVCVKRGGVKI